MGGSEKDSPDIKDDEKRLFEGVFQGLVDGDQKKVPEFAPKTLDSDANIEGFESHEILATEKPKSQRAKSALRIKYEAEVEQIKKGRGDLESMRITLGLSQRKICQLLLVDPSAWSRWISGKFKAPPHIYRALQWYMLLKEKHPQYKASVWLNTLERPQLTFQEIEKIKREVKPTHLEGEVHRLKSLVKRLILLQLVSAGLIAILLLL